MRLRQDALPEIRAQASLGDDIDLAAQNLLKVQLEPRQVQEIPARPEIDQQVEVACRARFPSSVREEQGAVEARRCTGEGEIARWGDRSTAEAKRPGGDGAN